MDPSPTAAVGTDGTASLGAAVVVDLIAVSCLALEVSPVILESFLVTSSILLVDASGYSVGEASVVAGAPASFSIGRLGSGSAPGIANGFADFSVVAGAVGSVAAGVDYSDAVGSVFSEVVGEVYSVAAGAVGCGSADVASALASSP